MEKRMRYGVMTVLALVVMITGACASGQVRVGFVGSQSGNQMNFTFSRFDGVERKTLQLSEGTQLVLDYAIELEEGSIEIEVIDPDGEISWESSITAAEEASAVILVEKGGMYQICVKGEDARGGFSLRWELD